MEIIASILFLIGIWAFYIFQETKACNYSKTPQIDYGKVNNDRIMNDLSNSQVNRNILNGKYNKR